MAIQPPACKGKKLAYCCCCCCGACGSFFAKSAFVGSAEMPVPGFWNRVRNGMNGVTSNGIFSRAESSGMGFAFTRST